MYSVEANAYFIYPSILSTSLSLSPESLKGRKRERAEKEGAHQAMDTFRPSSRPQPKRDRDGRDLEIVDPNTFKYVMSNNANHFGRSQPSFDDRSYDRKTQVEKKKSKSSSSITSWWNEPSMKRKRRLAKYKMFAIEGKVKNSLKKGQKWVKKKYSQIVHGY